MGKELDTSASEATPDSGRTSMPVLKRTPNFAAVNGMRYWRQQLIRDIEAKTQTQLLCCIGGSATAIRREDVVCLGDLLHNVKRGEPIDLMLHTPGGDIDAAEKMISMLSDAAGAAPLRIVIPDFAKSAGTLMALGSNLIVMSNSSELGPIDPQVVTVDRNGVVHITAILSYLDAFEKCADAVNNSAMDHAARVMLKQFDLARVQQYKAAVSRTKKLAEKLVQARMFRDGAGNYTAVATKLMDTERYQSHSQVIGCVEAQELGLHVEYMAPDEPLWQDYWQLYCHQRMAADDRNKLFESNHASLCVSDPI